jgi:BRCT domain type II-containing protein
VTFRSYTYNEEGEEILSNGHAFIGKIKVSIDSHPIAPEIEELKVNAEKEKEKRKTSKSKSPNRLVSTTPSRSKSPKRKRQLLNDITTNSS